MCPYMSKSGFMCQLCVHMCLSVSSVLCPLRVSLISVSISVSMCVFMCPGLVWSMLGCGM